MFESFKRSKAALSPARLGVYHTRGHSPDARLTAARHVEYVDRRVVEAIEGERKRLLLSAAVRHGKSTEVSIYTPAWFLGRFPDRNVILACHTHDLSSEHSEKARNVLRDCGEDVFGVQVDEAHSAKDDWKIQGRKGGMRAAGIGGAITGRGADLLIIDDPTKDAQEAGSETWRATFHDWLKSTALSRLEPGGTVIVAAARWGLDDVIGTLAEEGGWDYVNLPAIAIEGDPLGRRPGQPLWPSRWPLKALEEQRAALGNRWFSALFQGDPVGAEGAMFSPEWIVLLDEAPSPEDCVSVRAWDLSAGARDHSAGVRIDLHLESGKFCVSDVRRGRWSPAQVRQQLRRAAESDGHGVRVVIEQEGGGSGRSWIETLRDELSGYLVEGVRPVASKALRAEPLAAAMEAGNVGVVEAPWTEAFLDELLRFPGGRGSPDQVDAAAHAFTALRSRASRYDDSRLRITIC